MVKVLSGDILSWLGSTCPAMATCWKITRTDGVVLGFTDWDMDITLPDGTFCAASTGFTRTAIDNNSDLSVDNLEVQALLDSENIDEVSLRNGVFDYARILVMLVNPEDLSIGHITLRSGILGEVRLAEGTFVSEIRGVNQFLQQIFVEPITVTCPVELGDSKCKIGLERLGVNGTVMAVDPAKPGKNFLVHFSGSVTANKFALGYLKFTSGNNNGSAMEIVSNSAPNTDGYVAVLTVLNMPGAIQIGDTLRAYPGCDKTATTCQSKFGNILNFRGYNFVAGNDVVMLYPNAHQ